MYLHFKGLVSNRKARLRWFGYANRRDHERIGRQTLEQKKRKTKAEMDGLCQHENYRDNKRRSPRQNWLEENCVCRSDPHNQVGAARRRITNSATYRSSSTALGRISFVCSPNFRVLLSCSLCRPLLVVAISSLSSSTSSSSSSTNLQTFLKQDKFNVNSKNLCKTVKVAGCPAQLHEKVGKK